MRGQQQTIFAAVLHLTSTLLAQQKASVNSQGFSLLLAGAPAPAQGSATPVSLSSRHPELRVRIQRGNWPTCLSSATVRVTTLDPIPIHQLLASKETHLSHKSDILTYYRV